MVRDKRMEKARKHPSTLNQAMSEKDDMIKRAARLVMLQMDIHHAAVSCVWSLASITKGTSRKKLR